MFLDQDERLLLFHQRPVELSLDSLKGFRDAGIKTVKQGARFVSWHEIEQVPGIYDWSIADAVIEKTRESGLKQILDLYWRAPDWLNGCIDQVRTPGTWWLNVDRVDGKSWRAVDPFTSAAERELEFLERACEHFSAPDVLCAYAMPYGGERILPFGLGPEEGGGPCYDEEFCIDVVLPRQEVFARYGTELWTSLHPFHADATSSVDRTTLPYVGNEHMWAVYEAMAGRFPNHALNIFITEYFVPGGKFKIIKERSDRLDRVQKWVGAQFVEGVTGNCRKIEQHDIHGLIMAYRGVADEGQPTQSDFDVTRRAVDYLTS